MPERKNDKVIDWLLEKENPSVRFFTLTKIKKYSPDSGEVQESRDLIMRSGPVPQILALQNSEGWWGNPEHATMPMYTSTAWQLMVLAELGASIEDHCIEKAVNFVFSHSQDCNGAFPHEGVRWQKKSPMDLICNDAMIAWGLIGVGTPIADQRMKLTIGFLANAIYQSDLVCRFNKGFPCAWGVVKALRVLSIIPEKDQTPKIVQAVNKAVEFILSYDLSKADFPTKPGGKVSGHWFKLGFPRSYQTDFFQTTKILVDLGHAKDKRIAPAVKYIRSKMLPDQTWPLEDTIHKTLIPFLKKSKRLPSKWTTWQALYILSEVEESK